MNSGKFGPKENICYTVAMCVVHTYTCYTKGCLRVQIDLAVGIATVAICLTLIMEHQFFSFMYVTDHFCGFYHVRTVGSTLLV